MKPAEAPAARHGRARWLPDEVHGVQRPRPGLPRAHLLEQQRTLTQETAAVAAELCGDPEACQLAEAIHVNERQHLRTLTDLVPSPCHSVKANAVASLAA
jgi:hypothetical protein